MKDSKDTARLTGGRSAMARAIGNAKFNLAMKQKPMRTTFKRFNSSRGK